MREKVNRYIADWERIFSISKTNKGLISRTYKELLQINKKKIAILIRKKGRDYGQTIYKHETLNVSLQQ